ncbi:MAG: transposase [Gammaproteobacteria bacterium]|nr:transposase [Gammaproteobacteria bacterium]
MTRLRGSLSFCPDRPASATSSYNVGHYRSLKGSKYDWLYNPHNMTHKQKLRFKVLGESTLKTARAWAIKELAMSLWHYVSLGLTLMDWIFTQEE